MTTVYRHLVNFEPFMFSVLSCAVTNLRYFPNPRG